MKGKKLKTVGVSPKAPAAGLTAVLATVVVALVAEQFDTKLDVNTVQALIGAVVAGVGALAGAVAARPGPVVAADKLAPRRARSEAAAQMRSAGKQDGQVDILTIGAICGIVALVLVLVILF